MTAQQVDENWDEKRPFTAVFNGIHIRSNILGCDLPDDSKAQAAIEAVQHQFPIPLKDAHMHWHEREQSGPHDPEKAALWDKAEKMIAELAFDGEVPAGAFATA